MIKKKTYKILVVDDENYVIDIIDKILKSELENVEVFSANNVTEGLGVFNEIDIDLAFIDYGLPNGDGNQLVKKIKDEKNILPVIVMTGQKADIKLTSLKAGANVFIQKPFDSRELVVITKNLLSLGEASRNLESAENIIVALSRAIETRDTYTEGHSQRVADYSLYIYEGLGLKDDEDRDALHIGCLLHDIGKIGIPDDILKSTKHPLDKNDFEMIKTHPVKGFEICKDLHKLKSALSIIRHHHEKLDGSGYPDGLKENDIPLITQITAVADVYDALTSKRSYRHKNTSEEAFKIMEEDAKNNRINRYIFEILKREIKNWTFNTL